MYKMELFKTVIGASSYTKVVRKYGFKCPK